MYIKHEDKIADAYLKVIGESIGIKEEVEEAVAATPVVSNDDIMEDDDPEYAADAGEECWCTDLKAALEDASGYTVVYNEDENILEVTDPNASSAAKAEIEMVKDNAVLITCFALYKGDKDYCEEFNMNDVELMVEFIEECFNNTLGKAPSEEDMYTDEPADEAQTIDLSKEMEEAERGSQKVTENFSVERTAKLNEIKNLIASGKKLSLELFDYAPVALQHLYVMKNGYDIITPEYFEVCKPLLKADIEKHKKAIVKEAVAPKAGGAALPKDRVGPKGWMTDNDSARRTSSSVTGMQSVGKATIPNVGAKSLQEKIEKGLPIPVEEFAQLSVDDQIKYITAINFKVKPVTKAGKVFDYKSRMKPETRYWYWEDMSETGGTKMKQKWEMEAAAQPKDKPTGKDFGTPVADTE